MHRVFSSTALTSSLLLAMSMFVTSASAQPLSIRAEPGQIVITSGNQPIATYVYHDSQISRPYFAHVHAPGGVQVTRSHPPKPGVDLVDHATFHPGIWLAFGDLSGQDYWRNKARVRHDKIVEVNVASETAGNFTVQNSYCLSDSPDEAVCQELCRYSISIEPRGYLLVCDSLFDSTKPFSFGDQEEMGLGVRLATPITVKSGGQIIDAAGRINEKAIWGKATEWCDYAGVINGQKVGVMVMSDPANFRPMRLHVRDYGLLTANPFGQKSFGESEASRIEIAAGQPFRLRFAVLLHATQSDDMNRQDIYSDVVRRLAIAPRPKR